MKKLRFNNRVLRTMAEVDNIDLYSGAGMDADSIKARGFTGWVTLYWRARQSDEPALTIEQASAECDEMQPGEVIAAVNDAMRAAFSITATATEPEATPAAGENNKSDAAE